MTDSNITALRPKAKRRHQRAAPSEISTKAQGHSNGAHRHSVQAVALKREQNSSGGNLGGAFGHVMIRRPDGRQYSDGHSAAACCSGIESSRYVLICEKDSLLRH